MSRVEGTKLRTDLFDYQFCHFIKHMANSTNPLQIIQHHEQQIQQESDDLHIQSLTHSFPNWPYQNNINATLNNSRLSPQTLPDSYSDSGRESEDDDADSLADMNFVTNLFENRRDCVSDNDDVYQDFIFTDPLNQNFDFRGFGSGQEVEDELGFQMDRLESAVSGLRVVGIDSESDVEEIDEVSDEDHGVCLPNSTMLDDDDGERDENEELNWDELVADRQGLSVEVTVNSEISYDDSMNIGEEDLRDLEWDILLAENNFNREYQLENDDLYVTVQDGYIYAVSSGHPLFAQQPQTEDALQGSPPAAKSVVENLVSVILTHDYAQENNVVCAVCKDEINVLESATRLPCSHHYHGECIVPWLNIRNTCPVCRFELPTDDADYERERERRGVGGLLDYIPVRYGL